MTDKTYVFGDLEVKLTGRQADKKLKASRRTTSRTANSPATEERVITVYEITPADKEEGSWKKWVKITDLYEIGDEE